MTTEDDVRRALRDTAAGLGDPVVPRRMRSTGLRERIRRRRRRTGVALAVVTAVTAVVVAVGIGEVGTAPRPASDPTATPPTTTQAAPAPVDVLGTPTRGSLAGDPAALATLEARDWDVDPAFPVTPTGPRRVVFAGDLPGARWALVAAATTTGELAGQWFTGPAGADPADLVPPLPARALPTDRTAALTDMANGLVLVLGAPGDRVQLSDRPVIDAGGDLDPQWRDVDTVEGVAVDAYPPAITDEGQSTRYRVVRDGVELAVDRALTLPRTAGGTTPSVEYLRPQDPDASSFDQYAAGQLMGDLGLPADQLQFFSLWGGAVPGPPGGSSSLSVLGVRVPSGALAVAASDVRFDPEGGSEGGAAEIQQVVPAGVPDDQRVVALHRTVTWYDGQVSDDLVVVVPDGVSAVTVLDADGATLTTLPVVGGAAVATFPAGATDVQVDLPQGAPVRATISQGPLW